METSFCPQGVFMFYTILKIKRGHLHKKTSTDWSLCGGNWISKYYFDKLQSSKGLMLAAL
jgi:hypothetical protein